MKNTSLLWYLLEGTRGGNTRAKILSHILERPKNTNVLTKLVQIDYKTTQHHIRMLLDNRIITSVGNGNYGQGYIIVPEIDKTELMKILSTLGINLGKST